MKKLLISYVLIILVFISCKKVQSQMDVSYGTIMATVNGVNYSFNYGASGGIALNNGQYNFTIYGYSAPLTKNPHFITVEMVLPIPITVGTYTRTPAADSQPAIIPVISYHYSSSNGATNSFYGADGSTPYPATITITSISTNHIEGTFNGVLILEGDIKTTVTVSNGMFSLDNAGGNSL
jgi:hypothetical protein